MNMSAAVDDAIAPKLVPGSKELQIVCATCTFINTATATVCEMCGAEVKPPTHDVQANGSWTCGSCATVNRKGAKACTACSVPLSSTVLSAAPSQIFCPHCGFLNDGANLTCVQCDTTIRSTLAKLSTDLRDSTNVLARDMGVNITVQCPGCAVLCVVPPATACLRCGTCHTYFASPSVGDATNFHVARLATSISSSFMGLFQPKTDATTAAATASDAPVGKLIALGDKLPRSPLRAGRTRSNSASFRSSANFTPAVGENPLTIRQQRELAEQERALAFTRQEHAFETMHAANYQSVAPTAAAAATHDVAEAAPVATPLQSPLHVAPAMAAPAPTATRISSRSNGYGRNVPAALLTAPTDLVKVEGEIVEL